MIDSNEKAREALAGVRTRYRFVVVDALSGVVAESYRRAETAEIAMINRGNNAGGSWLVWDKSKKKTRTVYNVLWHPFGETRS